MTTKTVFLSVLASLLCVSVQAAITLEYDNATGAYAVSGTDSGPGGNFGTRIVFDWDWGADLSFANEVLAIFTGVVADDGISGTVDGDAFVADAVEYDNSESIFIGFSFTTPLQTGALVLNNTSGTISSGLWTYGDDTYIGADSYAGEDMSLVVGNVVPEPSTYAALAGVLFLGLAVWKRRKY